MWPRERRSRWVGWFRSRTVSPMEYDASCWKQALVVLTVVISQLVWKTQGDGQSVHRCDH